MVKKDLERVGIPYENEHGVADFHAAGRHTHITELLRNGATLPEAKELARHSDIKTTMRYTHIGLDDQAKAIAKLPTPKLAAPAAPADSNPAALHGRCIPGVSDRREPSSPDTDSNAQKRQNPCTCKGLGTDRRQLSHDGKVGVTGFEPAAFWSQTRRSSQAELHPGMAAIWLRPIH